MKKFDVVHVKKVEGRDKPVYNTVGLLIVKDDGKVSLKLNSIPVGEWDGWLNCFEQKVREEEPF